MSIAMTEFDQNANPSCMFVTFSPTFNFLNLKNPCPVSFNCMVLTRPWFIEFVCKTHGCRWRLRNGSSAWWRKRTNWAFCVTAKLRSSSSTTPTNCSSTPARTWVAYYSSTQSTVNRTRTELIPILLRWEMLYMSRIVLAVGWASNAA